MAKRSRGASDRKCGEGRGRKTRFEQLEPRLVLDSVIGLGAGLVANYFADEAMSSLVATRIDDRVHFDWGTQSPVANAPADGFAVRWAGKLQAQKSETYTLFTQTAADDGLRLTIFTPDPTVPGGQLAQTLIDTWTTRSSAEQSASLALTAGETYDLVIDYFDASGNAAVDLKWSSPSTAKTIVPQSQLYAAQVLAASSVGRAWLNEDIGAASAGSFALDGPVASLVSSGAGIGGAADQFQFAAKTVCGDAIAVARVEGLSGDQLAASAAAGLMIRESADAGARFVGLFLTPGGVKMQARATAGQAAEDVATLAAQGPVWLKLVRHGPTLNGYVSSTGEENSWTLVGRFDLRSLNDQVLVGLAAAAGATAHAVTAQMTDVSIVADIPLGANLGGVSTYGGTQPFIDYVKAGAGTPLKLDTAGKLTGTAATLDAVDRWPTEDFGLKGVYLQKPDGFSGYSHIVTFNGKATLGTGFASLTFTAASSATGDAGYVNGYNAGTNASKYYVKCTDYSASNNTNLSITFRNTQRTAAAAAGTGVTNVQLLQSGYTSYDESQVFTKEWIEAAQRAKVLRFMDWAETNGNLDTTWADRTTVAGHFNQEACWEYMVQLANFTHRDMWVNIPAHADNDYILKLAQLIRFGSNGVTPFTSQAAYDAYVGTKYRGLDPDLNVYVEYSNEVWNYSFESWAYASGQANAAYTAGAKFGPNQVTLNFDGSAPGSSTQERTNRWLGAHLVGDIVSQFRQVFGDAAINTRVRAVDCGWQIYANTTCEQALKMIDAAGWSVKDNVYAVSVTGYFGYTDLAQAQVAPNTSRDTATEEELIAIFQQSADNGASVLNWQTATALGAAYGLKHVAYESGPSIGGTLAQAAAQMDERFRNIELTGLNNWFGAGAELTNFFALNYTNSYGSQYGDWCFSDNHWDENQPRAQAYWDVRGAEASEPVTAGFTALPSGELAAAAYVNNSSAAATAYIQNTGSKTATYRYLIRAVIDMDVDLRVSCAATATGQAFTLKVNNQVVSSYSFPTLNGNDPAGNRLFNDTAPVTIHLRAGLNAIDISAPGSSSTGSPRLNSLKFSPVGQSPVDSQPWAYSLPGNPQGITEGANPWTSTNIDFQDLNTPAIANQPSPFTVSAVSDNPAIIPNDAAHIAWTYNTSTTKWTLSVTPAAGMTGKANLTITVSDAGGARRSWVFPFEVKPKAPTAVTAVANTNGTVTVSWTNPSLANPTFKIERSPDNSVWAQVGLTAPQANGAVSFSDLPPGNSTWYYRVTAIDDEGLASSAVAASGTATTPATSVGGGGLNSTSLLNNLLNGKKYFAQSNGTAGAGAFSSGKIAAMFDAAMTYPQFKSNLDNRLAITGLAGSAIDVLNFTFPIILNSYSSLTTVIPPGVKVYYSTSDYSSSEANALNPANYAQIVTTSYALSTAKVKVGTDRYQTTIAGLAIPAGAKSLLLVFDNPSSGGPQIASIEAFSVAATAAVSNLGYATTWMQQAPATFANYVGAAVNLTWQNPTGVDYVGLVVQRDATGDWTGTDLRTWNLSANATSFLNDRDKQDAALKPYQEDWDSTKNATLPASTSYKYRVGVVKADGTIVYSSMLSVTTAAASYTLATPTGLTATAASDHSIQLTWTAVAGATGYKIERTTTSGYTSSIYAMAAVTSTTWTDPTLIPNAKYYYRVRATNGTTDSAWATANATTQAITAAPTGLVAADGAGSIRLFWNPPVGKVYAYEVYRGTAADQLLPYATYVQATSPIIVPEFTDTQVVAGTTYFYAVRGMFFKNISPGGMQYTALAAPVQVKAVATLPLAPADLAATQSSFTSVNLHWTDYAYNEAGFQIDWANDAAFTQNVQSANVGANVTAYSVGGLTSAATYYFRAQAKAAAGQPLPALAAPRYAYASIALDAPPSILSWASAADHGAQGEAALLVLDNGSFTESRSAGITRLLVSFSEAIDPATFVPAAVQIAGTQYNGAAVDLSSITITTSLRNGNTVGVVDFSTALPDVAKYTVRINGVKDTSANALAGDNDRVLAVLRGDASGDGVVNSIDLARVRANRVSPISPLSAAQIRADLSLDGIVDSADYAWVRANVGHDSRGIVAPTLPTGAGLAAEALQPVAPLPALTPLSSFAVAPATPARTLWDRAALEAVYRDYQLDRRLSTLEEAVDELSLTRDQGRKPNRVGALARHFWER